MASVELGEDYPEIRESVRRICADFPNEYWHPAAARRCSSGLAAWKNLLQ